MTLEPKLDVETVVARRLELGYSHRDMERVAGISASVMRGLEGARSHGRVTLDLLFRLAEGLQLPAGQLLREDHPQAGQVAPGPGDTFLGISEDARRIGQLLLAAGKGVPTTALVRATGLKLRRVNAAVAELKGAGDNADSLLRVTTNNSRVALLPRDDATSRDEVRALERQVMAVDELKHPAARMLSAVVHGEITTDREQNISRGDRPHLQSLLKRGLVSRAADGRLSLSEEVAFSLGLVSARTAKLRPPTR